MIYNTSPNYDYDALTMIVAKLTMKYDDYDPDSDYAMAMTMTLWLRLMTLTLTIDDRLSPETLTIDCRV
jgi:hypothetical protein